VTVTGQADPAVLPGPPPCCPGAAERWVPVVTDHGPFTEWPHFTSDHGRYCTAAGRVLNLKDSNRPHGGPPYYKLVTLCAHGTKWTYSVHKTQYLSFAAAGIVPAPRPGEETSHLNDIPDDNHLPNLTSETHERKEARKAQQPGWHAVQAKAARSERSRRSRAADLARRAAEAERDRRDIRHSRSPIRRWWRAVTAHAPWRKG